MSSIPSLLTLCRQAATARSSPRWFAAATAVATRPIVRHRPAVLAWRGFSSEAAPVEKPLVPGVGVAKTSTGLVGLAVEPDWYNVIVEKFQLLLDTMEASDMPETAQYRIDVTKWANFVIQTAHTYPDDPEAVEEAVKMGQVEELIEMAEDEMIAMEVYLRTRMWELAEQMNPAIITDPNPMKDEMGPDGDENVQENIRKGMETRSE